MSGSVSKGNARVDGARTELFDVLLSGRVAAYELDLDANRIEWSENLETLHGLDSGDPVTTLDQLQRQIHSEDWANLKAAVSEAFDKGSEFHLQYRYLCPNRTMQWFETHGHVRKESGNDARRVIGICIEITDTKRSEVRLTVQHNVTQMLAESEDLNHELPQILRIICEALGWDVGEYWGWDPEDSLLRNDGQWCAPSLAADRFKAATSTAVFQPSHGLPGKVWSQAEPLWVTDVTSDGTFTRRGEAIEAGLHAGFAFPVRGGRGISGVMAFFARQVIAPDNELLKLFDVIGHQIGSFIERRIAEIALKKRAAQQTAVAQLGLLALSRPPTSELLDRAVNQLAETLDVDLVKVVERQPDRDSLILRAGLGWKAGAVGSARVSADSGSQAGFTLMSSEPVIVDDLSQETRFKGSKLLTDHEVVSGVSVVIGGREQTFGVLGVHTRRHRTFSVDDSSFVQAVANVLAMAIEARYADETIRQLSTPVLPLHKHLLILPLVGVIDARRMSQVSDQLLESVRAQRAKVVVIDTTGVARLEPDMANKLVNMASSTRLLGAELILTGVSGQLAKALTDAKVDVTRVMTLGDLRSGIEAALSMLER